MGASAFKRPLRQLVARAKPLVPERLWPTLLTLRSLTSAGPVLGLPAFDRVLVLAAHPDDESMGCAGTIALLVQGGAEVTIAFATSGDATAGSGLSREATGAAREREAAAACAVLGIERSPHFWRHPDGALEGSVVKLTAQVCALLDEVKPDAILLPWFLDNHRDHQAVNTALRSALEQQAAGPDAPEIWGFEVWTPLPPTRLVDISAVASLKQSALAAHELAHRAFDVSAAMHLSRWRSVHAQMGEGHAEAFLAGPAQDYFALCEKVSAEPSTLTTIEGAQ
jgi:LmbE family N-acetylglucosaminyl deacetylase